MLTDQTVVPEKGWEMGLLYIIKDCCLVGDVGGLHFLMRAVSGGRAGSKVAGAVNQAVANNPYRTGQKLKKSRGVVGGPIPCGRYEMRVDLSKTSKWIRLVPHASNFMAGRGGFAIHGRGPRGSDGCIVPVVYAELVSLWNAVKENNGGTLEVVAGDLSSVTV